MIVREINSEPISAITTLMAIGPTKSPMFPSKRKMGIKPNMVVSVEARSGTNRCETLLAIAPTRVKLGSCKLMRISSVITMALSISKPMAMIMPKIDIW